MGVEKQLEVCWLTLNRICNLRCYFCYARGTGYDANKTMTLENARKILSFCNSASIKHLVLIGGEPTLYSNLFSLLEDCSNFGFKVHLSTNGIRFCDDDFCKSLFSIIKPSINVSIKGHNSESYIKTTSTDAFTNLIAGFKNLSKYDVDYHVSYVITEENIDCFLEGVKKAFDLGASALHLSFAYDFKTEIKKNSNFLYENNPLQKIKNLINKFDEVEKVTKGNWDFENGYPLCFYSQDQIDKIGKHLATGCQMLFGDGILFDTDLNVIPCNSMYSVKMGQLGNHFNSYNEFIQFSRNNQYKDIRTYLESLPSKQCKICKKVEYCGGGCTLFWSQTDFNVVKEYINANASKFGLDKI